jgi:hypothetical protein
LSIENGRVESFDHNGWEFFTLVRRTEPREEKITNYLSPSNKLKPDGGRSNDCWGAQFF